jgi:predicted  nucleic acid-binding Zn-ribbon protein
MVTMTITEQLTLLAELARVELKLKTQKERLEAIPKAVRDAEAVAAQTEKKLTDLETKFLEIEKERRAMESQLAAERDQLKKWNARLDKIRDEREHGALMSEISTQKRSIGHLENDILEKMEVQETLEGEVKAQTSARDKANAHAKEEHEKVKDDLAVVEGEIAVSDVARASLVAKLPEVLVKRYQRIAASRGQGVAILTKETCNACKRTIPPQLALQVYKGAIIEQCPSCSRILVHEAMTRSESTDAAA